MDENKNHPVRLLTNLLSDLIIRLSETERQLDEARKSSDEWYQHWQTKDAQLKAANDRIAELETQLGIKDMKGATDNG